MIPLHARWLVVGLLLALLAGCSALPRRTFDVRNSGATGDGVTRDTPAFTSSIKACRAMPAEGPFACPPANIWSTLSTSPAT